MRLSTTLIILLLSSHRSSMKLIIGIYRCIDHLLLCKNHRILYLRSIHALLFRHRYLLYLSLVVE